MLSQLTQCRNLSVPLVQMASKILSIQIKFASIWAWLTEFGHFSKTPFPAIYARVIHTIRNLWMSFERGLVKDVLSPKCLGVEPAVCLK